MKARKRQRVSVLIVCTSPMVARDIEECVREWSGFAQISGRVSPGDAAAALTGTGAGIVIFLTEGGAQEVLSNMSRDMDPAESRILLVGDGPPPETIRDRFRHHCVRQPFTTQMLLDGLDALSADP